MKGVAVIAVIDFLVAARRIFGRPPLASATGDDGGVLTVELGEANGTKY